MDLPLYTTVSRTELSDLGSTDYHLFDRAVVLDQVMRQAGQHADQKVFRDLLLRLRNAESTVEDWRHLMRRTPAEVGDVRSFDEVLHLFPTAEAVSNHNVNKLRASGQPIALIKAVHTGPGACKATTDDAGGLEPAICIAHEARVMLCANLWVDVGLVNGATGTVVAICYESGQCPPDLPVAVMVRFDSYSGPTLPDGTVPITPLRRTWFATAKQCSRLQLPLKLAWAVTIHKSQSMTLSNVVIEVGKKEFSTGLTFVACSRVRRLNDLLFIPPFPYQRLANLAKSSRLQERLREDARLSRMNRDSTLVGTEGKESGGERQVSDPLLQEIANTSLPDCHADLPPPDPSQISNTSVPTSPALLPPPEMGDDDDDVIITHTHVPQFPFKYFPVDEIWQRFMCLSLGLNFVRSNGIVPGGPDVRLEAPGEIRHIGADGNCLFRSFSFIITGSEEQHMPVRRAILQHMERIWHLLISGHINPNLSSVASYTAATHMDIDGTWGTDKEIMTMAHLLHTSIHIYSVQHSVWQRFTPRDLDRALPVSPINQMGMYIKHMYIHYEVVRSVRGQHASS